MAETSGVPLINTIERDLTPEERQQVYFEEGGQLVVDLSSIGEMKFEAMPKGIHLVRIDEVNYGMGKDRGQAERFPRFEFVFAPVDEQYKGRKMFYYASFSPKALSGTKTALLRIAPEIFDKKFNPEEIANNGVLLGRTLRVKVDHEEYQGVTRAKVQYILPAEGETGAEGATAGGGSFFS